MKNGTQGFTLIELLIVVAIIGILAAVLIPNLLGARARANDAATKGWLDQVAKAQEIYYIDNDTYGKIADLTADGLKAEPANTTGKDGSADATSYCIEATNSNGQEKTFKVTNKGGIEKGGC